MSKPSTFSINVSKIDKSLLYEGKKGKYLNCALFENRDGPDDYGNTHFIVQEVSKEQRESGVKGPIIGNAKITGGQDSAPRRRQPDRNFERPEPKRTVQGFNSEDDIDF